MNRSERHTLAEIAARNEESLHYRIKVAYTLLEAGYIKPSQFAKVMELASQLEDGDVWLK